MLSFASLGVWAQTVIVGKVIDLKTNEGVPFANVFIKSSSVGTTTDFDGNFKITTTKKIDSLTATCVNYKTQTKPLKRGVASQKVTFYLAPAAIEIAGFEVSAKGENPAWAIMRKVIKRKKVNDLRKLSAYEYESYSKVELDVDNISEKFTKRKIVSKVVSVLDSIAKIKGEDGKPIMPVFFSETISRNYFVANPDRRREDILKSKISGIALEDGSYVSQLLGTSFQQFNFYENWVKLVSKDFISPIADSWRAFYDYKLEEVAELVGEDLCYRIAFKPKRKEDLAFHGTMWIADSTFALKRINLTVDKAANLNFIEKIVLQQELVEAEKGGAWLPSKTRIVVDMGEVVDSWAGMLAKFYVSNKDYSVNAPKKGKFYDENVTVDKNALVSDDKYWAEHRHDSLSKTDVLAYSMIDTMRNLPIIRTYVDIVETVVSGYKTIGKFDIGPYTYLWNFNNVEGNRFQLGFRTNYKFSRELTLKGQLAYGVFDEEFKYSLGADYILNRDRWWVVGASYKHDIDQVGFFNDNFDLSNNTLFVASSRFGDLIKPYFHTISKAYTQIDVVKNMSQKVELRNRQFRPLFPFTYFTDDARTMVDSNMTSTELRFEARLAPKEKVIQNDNKRQSWGSKGWPVLTLRYALGMKGVLNGDFDYQSFGFTLEQNIKLGIPGRLRYTLSAGYIPSTLPYPLLESHLGSRSLFYNSYSFNLMRIFEFVSDQYVSLKLYHRFDGLIANRIPLFNKLHLRFFGTANILYGSLSQKNLDKIPQVHTNGIPYAVGNGLEPIPSFKGFGNKPYIEIGYGVSNILRFIRLDFLHRISYLKDANGNSIASPFGIRVSTQFDL